MASTKGLFARGLGITGSGTTGLFARGLGISSTPAVDIPEGPRTLRFEVDARGLLLERPSRTLRFEV